MLKPSFPNLIPESPYDLLTNTISENPLQNHFERILRLGKSLFDVPYVLASALNEQTHTFQSLCDQDSLEIPYESSFGKHVLHQEDIFYISDTLKDERFCFNPYVRGEPHIRFYAGHPIRLHQKKIGTLSIADSQPRYFSQNHLNLLKDLTDLIEIQIQNHAVTTDKGKLTSELKQARMASMVDSLTGLWNRQGIYNILRHRMDEYFLNGTGFAVAILDIDYFKNINDTYGHDSGDHTLQLIAQSLITGCRETDAIGRWGGEEFLILINDSNPLHVAEIAERIRHTIREQKISLPSQKNIEITVTIGLTTISPHTHPTLEDLIKKADMALYQGKRLGRNQVVIA